MENRILISIIMPVYNAAEYIDKAIESVVSQTHRDLELILVDDCSTDESSTICDRWANFDARIRVFHLDKNSGAGKARNYGIEKASGDYLTFVDSDDVIESDLYEKLLSVCTEFRYDTVVWGMTERYFNDKEEVVSENYVSLEDTFCNTQEEVRKFIIRLEEKTLFGYQCNHLYNMSIIKDNNIRFRAFHLYEDYFFNLEYIEFVSSMAVLSNKGYYYNKRMNQSLTKQFVADYFKLSRMRIAGMAEAYRRWGLMDKYVHDVLGRRYLRYYCSALMRNNDPKSGMRHADRRLWVKNSFKDKLFLDIASHCHTDCLYLRVIQKLLNMHFAEGCLLLGRVLYIIRTKLPQLYAIKGQIH